MIKGNRAMSLLDELSVKDKWESFFEYKSSLAIPKLFAARLREFIDNETYLPVCEWIKSGGRFALPKMGIISKQGSEKKRVVFTYPDDENTVLKLLTYLLLRKYDGVFSRGLYSFRPNKNANDAVKMLIRQRDIDKKYCYKADISDYFNSIDISLLIPVLEETVGEDRELFCFLRSLLCEEYVYDRGRPVSPKKGIMAGTPLSSFYANLYLKELDEHFAALGAIYARYSDDLIVFADTRAELDEHIAFIKAALEKKHLAMNEKKEHIYTPQQGFEFLGFKHRQGVTDISDVSLTKLKKKMRRKARALRRWCDRNDTEPEKAALAFVRVFNRKLFESRNDNDLTWTRWYFPLINTDKSLKAIDRYAQDCIRSIITGRHNKARFKVSYKDIKALGFISLVHEYYKAREI